MEEYEKEKLDLFYNIYLDNYINNLEKTNSQGLACSTVLTQGHIENHHNDKAHHET